MNKKRVHTPEGVRDVYGIECGQRTKMKEKLNQVFASYGYEAIRTPGFEFFDVFNSEKGTVSSREMFKFFDREGNTLVLRPDVTPSIARCVAKYFNEEKMGIRLSYAGNVFLNNSSYQLKLKETCQLGAELVNDDSPQADSEVIAMAIDCFLAAGLRDFRISIGEVEFFQGLTDSIAEEEVKTSLREFILNKNYFGLMEYVETLDLSDKIKEVFLRFNELNGDVEILDQAEAMVENEISKKAIERLRKVYDILKLYGKEKYISFDLGMLNKHNYYTGIIFKGYTYGTGDAVLKGGRYDNLIEQFGKKAPSVGFAIVLDELMMAMRRQGLAMEAEHTEVMILYADSLMKDAVAKAGELRKKGRSVVLERKNDEISREEYERYAADHRISEILYFVS
ncbi:MAG: ATP phosphoribosyltransferase regulatory subunit [Anaerostipes sp.]|uniref:ATP phosphoribosyltransferase regulatory subunit n=1 Tax=Anaerostipes sp. TaxID=1872530 RepID=UPI003993DCC3